MLLQLDSELMRCYVTCVGSAVSPDEYKSPLSFSDFELILRGSDWSRSYLGVNYLISP